MGNVLDGVAPHMEDFEDEYTFIVSDEESSDIVEVLKILRGNSFELSSL